MKEFIFIYWPDCAKCHQLRPHCKEWAEKNGYKFTEVQYGDSVMEITSIPMAQILDEKGETILDFDGMVALISNQNKNDE